VGTRQGWSSLFCVSFSVYVIETLQENEAELLLSAFMAPLSMLFPILAELEICYCYHKTIGKSAFSF
jgi:hypothetical protein